MIWEQDISKPPIVNPVPHSWVLGVRVYRDGDVHVVVTQVYAAHGADDEVVVTVVTTMAVMC